MSENSWERMKGGLVEVCYCSKVPQLHCGAERRRHREGCWGWHFAVTSVAGLKTESCAGGDVLVKTYCAGCMLILVRWGDCICEMSSEGMEEVVVFWSTRRDFNGALERVKWFWLA